MAERVTVFKYRPNVKVNKDSRLINRDDFEMVNAEYKSDNPDISVSHVSGRLTFFFWFFFLTVVVVVHTAAI